jgi:hypothetical protein
VLIGTSALAFLIWSVFMLSQPGFDWGGSTSADHRHPGGSCGGNCSASCSRRSCNTRPMLWHFQPSRQLIVHLVRFASQIRLNAFPLLIAEPKQLLAHDPNPFKGDQDRILAPKQLMSFDASVARRQ